MRSDLKSSSIASTSQHKREFWRLAIDEHQGSNLSVRAFCKAEGLSEPSFYHWRRELTSQAQANSQAKLNAQPQTGFKQLNVTPMRSLADTTHCSTHVSIAADGLQLQLPLDATQQQMATLFAALKQVAP